MGELDEWLQALPKGLDTRLETGGRSISAGEAQLLAFTRVFLRNPGLVILDEASSRLDPATEQLIERAIDKLLKNRTAIIIAHRLGHYRTDDIMIRRYGLSAGNRYGWQPTQPVFGLLRRAGGVGMSTRRRYSQLLKRNAPARPKVIFAWSATAAILAGDLLAMLFLMLFYQIPGLVLREFFNSLSGSTQTGMNLWTIVALLFAAEIGSVLGMYGLITTNTPFFMNTMTLLRKNLLRHILRRPGASALPDSPGEAISRFRGDTFEISLFALWLNDLMGSLAFNIIALVVMVGISPTTPNWR
jgi:ABC-type multidrug transport system fused ATPase/permease subunit